MYKVYGKVRTRTFRVIWALEEMGLPYELIDAAPRSNELAGVSAEGKVPALVDGDAALTDSVAIMSYLADKHGKLTFPAGTIERARQDALIHLINERFDAPLWLKARHGFILPEERRIPEVSDAVAADIADAVEALAKLIEGPFLQGETMTVADILAVHCLNWAHGAKIEIANDTVKAYAKAMRARDAFMRTAAL